jgi:trimeric autotransporter adhesin
MGSRHRSVIWGMAVVAAGLTVLSCPAGATTAAGTITTVAGGVGVGLATNVAQWPYDVAAGPGGTVYVADRSRSAVRALPAPGTTESVVAGDGTFGFRGDGGPATAAELTGPVGAATDAAGNLVIADYENDRVRVVAASSGTFYGKAMTKGAIYTVAGNGTHGFSGDGRAATSAEINGPVGVVVDGSGNLVIADTDNNRVRVVAASSGTFYGQAMTTGDIYTVAGNGIRGFGGDGGPASGAALFQPRGVVVDRSANLVIVDSGNQRVRVVATSNGTFYGQTMTTGNIYTVAGNGTAGYLGEGKPALSAELFYPRGIAVDGAGNLVIADRYNNRIRVVAASTATFYGQPMTKGDIYTVAGNGVRGFAGDRHAATSAELFRPRGVAMDRSGNLVIADTGNRRVRVVAASSGLFYGQTMTSGNIYTVAGNGSGGFGGGYSGDGGPATGAELTQPRGLVVDGSGNLVIADSGNNRIRVVATSTGTFYGQAMMGGDMYTVAGNGAPRYSGDGGPAPNAGLFHPGGVVVDGAGNLVIADRYNNRVRVVAVSSGTFYGQVMTGGDIYTVAGNGTGGDGGDRGPAVNAELFYPSGVALDRSGNVVIADYENNLVRLVATSTGTFYGQAMTGGDIYTVAGNGAGGFGGDGGPATGAALFHPSGVTVDGSANLVIADTDNNRMRVVAPFTGMFYGQAMTGGDIYTVAGTGTGGFGGDGGAATASRLSHPAAVAVDGSGNLVIADKGNNRTRVVAASTGTFFGKVMTKADIYTVAGNGSSGFSGDGGPATSAQLASPAGAALDRSGNMLIADTLNSRVREVSGP